MMYKCAVCSKVGADCVKSLDLSSCLSYLKKTHPCDMTPYSEAEFSKFERKCARLCEEMKLACQ